MNSQDAKRLIVLDPERPGPNSVGMAPNGPSTAKAQALSYSFSPCHAAGLHIKEKPKHQSTR